MTWNEVFENEVWRFGKLLALDIVAESKFVCEKKCHDNFSSRNLLFLQATTSDLG